MGYRAGYQCFISSEAAHDYILSQQLPTIATDGTLIRPIKQGQNWYLNDKQIQLSFPECDIPQQIGQGVLISAPLIILAVLVFGFRQAIRLINSMSSAGDIDHD